MGSDYGQDFLALLELFNDDSYDEQFNDSLNELIADENEITTHHSTLLVNSVFNTQNNKRPQKASSSTPPKYQL